MKKTLLFVVTLVLCYSCKTSEKIDCDAYGCNNNVVKKK